MILTLLEKTAIALSILIAVPCQLSATESAEKDTIKVDRQDSALYLNAESDSKPRDISLGLPITTGQIFEDGMPVSYYINDLYPYKSWHGGASASSNGSMTPMETAMRYCEIGTYVDSYNKLGQDSFGGSVSYTHGSYGQNKFDINISGPIARGWQYSISTFQNFDPGSNARMLPTLRDRHQFYKAVINKKFIDGSGHMALVCQYVDYTTINDTYGPFIFVGDGSVRPYNGFSLGTDCYIPDLTSFSYMDMKTGEMKERPYKSVDKTCHFTFLLDRQLTDNIHFGFKSRFKTGTSDRGQGKLAGIETVSAESGYAYPGGSPFQGQIQKRVIMRHDALETSWMNNAEMQFKAGHHSVRAGADYHFNHGASIVSSALFAHQVCNHPQVLYRKGDLTYGFNSSGGYYDGIEHKTAIYAKDEWMVSKRINISGFVRGELLNIHGDAANNIGDETINTRYPGFNLTKGRITQFRESFLNGAAGIEFNAKIIGGLSFRAEAIATRIHPNISNYEGYYYPSTKPTDTRFIQAGLSYVNKWMNVVSQIIYISQSNYNTSENFQHKLQKPVGDLPEGYIETKSIALNYGIESLGWTTDANLDLARGLELHLNFMIREPRYRDFVFKPTFSDGITEEYDFNGNNVTALHKVEFTIEPSYSFRSWKFWLTARYIGKQFINTTNTLYFNGRWETFGGINYKLSRNCRLNLNVVNILNQKGASGNIGSADLVTDTSEYHDFLMSGKFIRPFTVELGIKVDL